MLATSLQSSHDCSCKSARGRSFMRTKSFSNGIFAPVTTPVSCTKRALQGKCPDPSNATGSPLKSAQIPCAIFFFMHKNAAKVRGLTRKMPRKNLKNLAQFPSFCAKS